MTRSIVPAAMLSASLALFVVPLGAQHAEHAHESGMDSASHAQMAGKMTAGAHMRMTAPRAPNAADSARAARIVLDLRTSLAKYRDVEVAKKDGYVQFAPKMKNPRVFHFTRNMSAVRNQFGFDAGRPSSLLYRRGADGTLQLTGAMYTAPQGASLDDLDKRVPLSVARWHLHTNFCVPKLRERERWKEMQDGHMVFGPASPIATREACDSVKGRFHPTVFGWMVHANVFESDDPRVIWGDEHGHVAGEPHK